jgi:hypothetical protein
MTYGKKVPGLGLQAALWYLGRGDQLCDQPVRSLQPRHFYQPMTTLKEAYKVEKRFKS